MEGGFWFVSEILTIVVVVGVPESEEHGGETPDGFAYDANAIVFPFAMGIGAVDVIIVKVDAAGEGDFAVYDHHFAVIAVVEDEAIEHVGDFIECNAFNSFFFEAGGRVFGNHGDATPTVVHDADVYAFFDFLF